MRLEEKRSEGDRGIDSELGVARLELARPEPLSVARAVCVAKFGEGLDDLSEVAEESANGIGSFERPRRPDGKPSDPFPARRKFPSLRSQNLVEHLRDRRCRFCIASANEWVEDLGEERKEILIVPAEDIEARVVEDPVVVPVVRRATSGSTGSTTLRSDLLCSYVNLAPAMSDKATKYGSGPNRRRKRTTRVSSSLTLRWRVHARSRHGARSVGAGGQHAETGSGWSDFVDWFVDYWRRRGSGSTWTKPE